MEKSLGSRYVLHEALGRGAMGQVFAGSTRPTGEPVAIKILRPEFVSDPEVVARFVQERTILMSIADPHVVRVIDLVIEGDTLAIVMELVQGPDLRRQLRDRRTVPPAEAVHLTGQLLRGVAAVHAAGIIHRDIKPENVLVDTSAGWPRLKLTDFGVARLSYGASLTRLSGVIGTPEYMAPELAEHNRATPAADLYSAGIVLYEMLCGRTPFAGGHPLAVLRRHTDQAPPVIPGVAPELWDRIAWLLAKDPDSRPASAAEAYAALAPLESSLASRSALAPWAGPEDGTPIRTVTPADQAYQQTHDGPARYATVLRHRDRGAVDTPDDTSGRTPRHGAGGPLAGLQMPPTSPPSRRKRQARMAALVVAVVAVIALGTTVALAATHRPVSQRPTASGRTSAPQETVSSASIQPTRGRKALAPDPSPTPDLSPSPASVSNVLPPLGTQPTPRVSVVTKTVAGPPPSSASPSPSSSPTATLSAAEQQLVNMLNPSILDNCTSRPQSEGNLVLAAVNCSPVSSGPTLRPLAETLTAGSATTWFQNNTNGFTGGGTCADGDFVGYWTHDGITDGRIGCGSYNGLYRIVWVVDGDVGLIADGSNSQTLHTWWLDSACQVVNAC
jgi:serine/threonine protein kinase